MIFRHFFFIFFFLIARKAALDSRDPRELAREAKLPRYCILVYTPV